MNKNVLVLGASSGVGESCVHQLCKQGDNAIIVARREERLSKIQLIYPSKVISFSFDLQNIDNIRGIFDFCKSKELLLDGMIYCAGVDATQPLKLVNYAYLDQVMRVNCYAFVESAKWFSNQKYSNKHSKIVAISSTASVTAEKGMIAYSMSKAALNVAVKTMSQEFVRRGILVNAILPAGILTQMTVDKIRKMQGVEINNLEERIALLDQSEKSILPDESQPYGIISPTDVARLAVDLVSDRNKYITGALIPISAGMIL